MLIYEVKRLPDLSLSKYQVFADSGINGMLEVQTQFIKQLHKVLMLKNVNAHFLFQYSPKRKSGNRLKIYLFFSGGKCGICVLFKIKADYCRIEHIKLFSLESCI